jgi:hypothetical protein
VAADFRIAPIVIARGELPLAVNSRHAFHWVSQDAGQSRLAFMADRDLEPKQAGFDGARPAQPPEQGGQPMNEFELDRRSRTKARHDGLLECSV